MTSYMPFIWLVAVIVLCAVEALTVQFVSIWFAAGAVIALIVSLFGAPLWAQFLAFFVIAGVLLIATRPLAKKFLNSKTVATNADMVIGQTGVVEEDIDNVAGKGRVHVAGLSWAARSADNANIAKDEKVVVKSMSGAKVIVEKIS